MKDGLHLWNERDCAPNEIQPFRQIILVAIPAVQEPAFHLPLTFHLDGRPFLDHERLTKLLPRRVSHLNSSGYAVRFHAARERMKEDLILSCKDRRKGEDGAKTS